MTVLITGEPRARKGIKKARPILESRAARKNYRQGLFRLNQVMKQQTDRISELIRLGRPASEILAEIEISLEQANNVAASGAEGVAADFVQAVQADNKRKFENLVKNALSVDGATILDSPATQQVILDSTAENVELITSIPTEHFDRVSKAVLDNFRGVSFEKGGLTNRLKKIGSISDRRAKFIARDQTAKLVGTLNEARQVDAGITEYIWRNMRDVRVVGNPGGLYPKGNRVHNDHWTREGERFSWKKPPPDGHPGQPINCRCRAEPYIDVEKMKRDALRV